MKYYAILLAALAFSSAAFAGPIDGSKSSDNTVNANSTDYYWETLEEGVTTNVSLTGNCSGPDDIDLWVYDENDNLIGKSTSDGCYEAVNVTPQWTGPFKIVVENSKKPYGVSYHLTIR